MNIKTEIIALAIRVLSNETTLIRKPTAFEALLSDIFGEESYDRKLAREIEEESVRLAAAAKRFSTNRKFKKITSHL